MSIGNIGRALAGQAIENTKKNVMDALRTPEAATPEKPVAPAPENVGATILGQIQAMQRALKEDQELKVVCHCNNETLRVLEIFVPSSQVFVLAGIDAENNVTRVITPVSAAPLVCKIVKVAEGAQPVRVNVLTPRPKPEPSPAT